MKRVTFVFSCCMLLVINAFSDSDFVISDDNDELLYTTSEVFPQQIAVFNATANVGVVLDTDGEKVSMFNGDSGQGVIIDCEAKIGVEIQKGGWYVVKSPLKDYIKDANVTELVMENSDRIFELEEQSPLGSAWAIAIKIVSSLCGTFLAPILKYVNLFEGIINMFGGIIHAIKWVLGPILNMASPVWTIFRGGFMGLCNIFKFLGTFFSSVLGGLPALLSKSVRFALTAIIKAANGAKVFFQIVKGLAKFFNLMTLIPSILQVPLKLTKFIVGFGGNLLKGITGVFGIVSKLFTFTIKSISTAVQSVVKLVLCFLKFPRPSFNDLGHSVDELLSVSEQQGAAYQNEEDFEQYKDYLQAYKGEGNYKIQGVKVAPFVSALMTTAHSAKVATMNILGLLSPLIPVTSALPHLLVHLVKSLNTTDGPSYVKQIVPSLDIPQDNLWDIRKNIAEKTFNPDLLKGENRVSPPELLRSLPVVGQIYTELDDVAKTHNASLDNLLDRGHISDLMDFTTSAFGLTN